MSSNAVQMIEGGPFFFGSSAWAEGRPLGAGREVAVTEAGSFFPQDSHQPSDTSDAVSAALQLRHLLAMTAP
jgi:hypothetical protein